MKWFSLEAFVSGMVAGALTCIGYRWLFKQAAPHPETFVVWCAVVLFLIAQAICCAL